MTHLLHKIPLWVRPILGLALVVMGSILALNSSASVKVFVVLVACGLITVGVTRIVGIFGKEPDEDQGLPGIMGLSGVLLVGAGIAALLWRGTTLPMLALAVSIALLISGTASLSSLFTKSSRHKTSSALSGLASMIAGLLVLLWPTLSLWVFGVFFGGWLIFSGLRLILAFFGRNHHENPAKQQGKFRTLSKLAGSVLALILAIGMVLVTSFIHSGDPRLVPDAFYTPPTTVPEEPGMLLRYEPLHEGIPQDADAWRILYTTTHPDGSPAVASGSVVVPKTHGNDPLPVISIAHGTKGIIPRCAPTLSARPLADGPAAALRVLVSEGWAGVTSDYVGLGTEGPHPYLVGQAEGRNVLDAYRAATELEGFTLRDDTVLWGHSQGGHGALFSAAIAKDYAPEIEILGVAALAPATNLVDLALGVKDSAAGKVVSSYIAGAWNEVFPELDVNSMTTPGYSTAVQRIGDLCFDGRDALAAVIRGTQLFDAVIPESAINGPIGEMLRENSVNMLLEVPLFVGQGLADQLVLPTMQQDWVAERCAAGQTMEYREYEGLDHMPLVEDESPLIGDLVLWAKDRLSGKEPLNTCP
ncbi:lipase [Arthrobacter sp. MYb227]|uniref:lipase family protein n=1 Tax=Arthrobacter sp. MYb227 TaxID=1848601 RepID=UPI000CFBD564|nr:lipase family protein [Arthrobacter sp. MYb227]PQZ89548.1 lipase [Arthrobacter sp. MYb227]